MKQLSDLFRTILDEGEAKPNRTGVGTVSIFGHQMRFPLQAGFPLATGKAVPFRLIASELLWFLKGEQDKPGAIDDLHKEQNHIWDEWAKPDGSFGPIYGVQWRHWFGANTDGDPERIAGYSVMVDQIAWLVNELKTNPTSRRLLVTAWQPAEIAQMALPPCHVLFQLNCRPVNDEFMEYAVNQGLPVPKWIVDLQLYQRSCDAFLGVPFNIASYALLLEMLVHVAGPEYMAGDFVWTGGDVHLYDNHLEQAKEYIVRDKHTLPRLRFAPDVPRDIDKITLRHCTDALTGYKHSGRLAAEVAV